MVFNIFNFLHEHSYIFTAQVQEINNCRIQFQVVTNFCPHTQPAISNTGVTRIVRPWEMESTSTEPPPVKKFRSNPAEIAAIMSSGAPCESLQSPTYDYKMALRRISDSRGEQQTSFATNETLINVLHQENIRIPPFTNSSIRTGTRKSTLCALENDEYSNVLLSAFGPHHPGMLAKRATGNGNCLFNSASLLLSGKCRNS